jgi:hypothetical protein
MDTRKQQKHFPWKRATPYKEPCREERFVRKTVVQRSRSRRSDQVSYSGREDTRSQVRNGASLKQSLMGSCYK